MRNGRALVTAASVRNRPIKARQLGFIRATFTRRPAPNILSVFVPAVLEYLMWKGLSASGTQSAISRYPPATAGLRYLR
jgi:hypothetical protein